MDGFNGFPNRLFEVDYFQSEKYPNAISIWFMQSTMSQAGILFQENQWYKELFAKYFRDNFIKTIPYL